MGLLALTAARTVWRRARAELRGEPPPLATHAHRH
jgi:hypothetical protein